MSAKKKDKSDWLTCANCDCSFTRLVLSKHQKLCNSIEEVSSSICSSDHGYIQNGIFHGAVKCFDHSQDSRIPSTKNDIVLMHPSTIKFCGLKVASSVVLRIGNRQTYGTLWPSSSVSLDTVSIKLSKINSLGTTENNLVEVHIPSCISVIASKVLLEPVSAKGIEVFSFVRDTILSELDDTNILCNDSVSCMYYGEDIIYKVKQIDGDMGIINSSDISEIDALPDKLLALDISSKAHRVSSTPIKASKVSNDAFNVSTKRFVYQVMFNKTNLHVVESEQILDDKELSLQREIVDNIGGLVTQKKLLSELITLPFTYPELYQSCHISPPRGIIVYGPSGTGKSCLVHAFVKTLPNIYTAVINGPELTSKYLGETESNLRNIFNNAILKSPSVLIIDEFDTICPIRSSSSNDSEKRLVATLSSLMDNIDPNTLFVVLAITNKLDAVDLSLRRPGRFDRDIEIGVPNVQERLDILHKLMENCKHDLQEKEFIEISEITHGYVGADISALCKESGLLAVKRLMESSEIKSNINLYVDEFAVTLIDFKNALCKIGPSAMKEVTVDIPKVFWTDVGGQNSVKQKLKEAIEWPLKHPEVFTRMGITPPRGLLMYGPPGCSKTLMAKALATESGLNFISIKGPELFNKYLGESERAVRSVFHKARIAAPSIVFFDEIDAISMQRSGGSGNVGDRVLAQILTELDGVESLDGVVIVAATNRPDVIDPALLRPGRIDRLIYVPLPDVETRKEIFGIQFRSIPVNSKVSIEDLTGLSEGYSGAEICSICREAALLALRENFGATEVNQKHFENLFNQIKPGTSKDMVKFYDEFVSKTTGKF